MKSIAECRLYAFVDAAYLRGRAPGDVAAALCAGGADIIQLRAKGAREEEVLRMGREVIIATNSAGVPLVINDFWSVAEKLGAVFCHLGQEDFLEQPPTPGPGPGLGLSTHSPEQARRALAARPDYIAVGPVYATGTKPGAKPVTLEYVRWAAANVAIPWFAIGGIHLDNMDDVLRAGAGRICVVSAILNAPDAAAACREFKTRLERRS